MHSHISKNEIRELERLELAVHTFLQSSTKPSGRFAQPDKVQIMVFTIILA